MRPAALARSALASTALAGVGLALLACTSKDPDWSKPCAQQRPASLEVGAGQSTFSTVGDAGVPIEIDTTGTYVWIGVSITGMGQDVTISCGLDDASGKALAMSTGQAIQLSYDSSANRDVAGGLAAQLVDPNTADTLIGQKVTLWAQATGCGRSASSTAATNINGYDATTCQGCLAAACAGEVTVCGTECVAIQACLDAYCVNLSANASPDELTCQASCQAQHPTGKQDHIALVDCVQSATCQPPCNGYSIDYDACVAAVNTGSCATPLATCTGSSDCASYKSCASGATTWSQVEACAAAHAAGEKLFEAYEACVETTCLTLGWLPHLSQ